VLLLPYTYFDDEIEIGWRFKKEYWGKGYATEASKVILDHALNMEASKKVVADILPENIASIRVAEKIGLRYIEDRNLNNLKWKSYQVSDI
jgi:RimJ/RimL family protein N-acetyltransferase